MTATLLIEVSDAPDVLEEAAAIDAQIAAEFGATRREAFDMGYREGLNRSARAALGGVTATPEQVAALVAAVERATQARR